MRRCSEKKFVINLQFDYTQLMKECHAGRLPTLSLSPVMREIEIF